MANSQTEEMEQALFDAMYWLEDLPAPPMELIEEIRSALRIEI